MADVVEVRRDGEIAILEIRRGEKLNTIDHEVWEAMKGTLLRLSDAPPMALIVTGQPNFCAGLDLSNDSGIVRQLEALSRSRDLHRTAEYVSTLRNGISGLGRLPCPVIAAIEGACLGAGLELAAACDIRIAAHDTILGMPDAASGLPAMFGGLVQIRRLIGTARTTDLLLSGRQVDARLAESWGLVTRVVEPGSTLTAALDLARGWSRQGRAAVVQTTLALRQLSGSTEDFAVESQAASRTLSASDLASDVLAALRRREPR